MKIYKIGISFLGLKFAIALTLFGGDAPGISRNGSKFVLPDPNAKVEFSAIGGSTDEPESPPECEPWTLVGGTREYTWNYDGLSGSPASGSPSSQSTLSIDRGNPGTASVTVSISEEYEDADGATGTGNSPTSLSMDVKVQEPTEVQEDSSALNGRETLVYMSVLDQDGEAQQTGQLTWGEDLSSLIIEVIDHFTNGETAGSFLVTEGLGGRSWPGQVNNSGTFTDPIEIPITGSLPDLADVAIAILNFVNSQTVDSPYLVDYVAWEVDWVHSYLMRDPNNREYGPLSPSFLRSTTEQGALSIYPPQISPTPGSVNYTSTPY